MLGYVSEPGKIPKSRGKSIFMRNSALTILILASLFSAKAALAQGSTTNSMIDTVTISAPDAYASETGPDPGRFEIRRTGPTNYSLPVFYRIAGTASNG